MLDDFPIGPILLVLWLVGGNFLINEFYRRRKLQVEKSLSTSIVLLSETGTRVRRSSYTPFSASFNWMKADVYLTANDLVVIRYYPIWPFLKLVTMYKSHYQIVLRETLAPQRAGISYRLIPVEPISIKKGDLFIKTQVGITRGGLRLSVHEPEEWLEAIQQILPHQALRREHDPRQ